MISLPRFTLPVLGAACLLAIGPHGAPAAAGAADATIYSTIDNERLLEILRAEGWTASVDNGIVVWKLDGFKSQLFVSSKKSSLQFHISFSDGNATLKKVNEWNRTKRYSRSYLDDEGDPHLELDLDLAGGVTRARIADFFVTCKASTAAWCEEVVQ